MTTGSVRGKCWAPQAGQDRRQPASATSEGAPHLAQNRWVACQPRMPLAAAAVPASSASSSAIVARRSAKPKRLGQARVAGARLVDERPRPLARRRAPVGAPRGRSAAPRPRARGRPAAPAPAKTSAAIGSQPSRGRGPPSSSGRPCQSGRQRARGSAASPACAAASPRRCAARSSVPPAKVTASASFIALSSPGVTMPQRRRRGNPLRFGLLRTCAGAPSAGTSVLRDGVNPLKPCPLRAAARLAYA